MIEYMIQIYGRRALRAHHNIIQQHHATAAFLSPAPTNVEYSPPMPDNIPRIPQPNRNEQMFDQLSQHNNKNRNRIDFR